MQKKVDRLYYLTLGITLILVIMGIWALKENTKNQKLISSKNTSNLQQILKNESRIAPPSTQEKDETEQPPTLVPQSEVEGIQTFKVSKIIDGDTIQLDSGQIVRYIGIDAPESKSCYSKEATEKNIEILLRKDVALEKDVSEVDKYGRLLRYVFVGEIFVNELLVREGFAKAFPYPPDVKHREIFKEAQKEARENNRGMWDQCTSQSISKDKPSQSKSGPVEGDKDCSDFKTQSEAQAFFLLQGGPEKDPHRLDQDRDGIACETLP